VRLRSTSRITFCWVRKKKRRRGGGREKGRLERANPWKKIGEFIQDASAGVEERKCRELKRLSGEGSLKGKGEEKKAQKGSGDRVNHLYSSPSGRYISRKSGEERKQGYRPGGINFGPR